jgi:glycosyltransferase involved in cell wall biosynthesis
MLPMPAESGAQRRDSGPQVGPRLDRPTRISEQDWPDGTIPRVSICCITFNHARFIADAMRGFLMQETEFPVEIVFHDDASTDTTQEVLRSYAARYPKLVRLCLQRENQWASGRKASCLVLAHAQGAFAAYCEGDDYWTDPRKLQQQVCLMEGDPSLAVVGHRTSIVNEAGHVCSGETIPDVPWPERMDLESYLQQAYFGLHMSSWLFRKSAVGDLRWMEKLRIADVPLLLEFARSGDIAFISETMSAYRLAAGSYWSADSGLWKDRAAQEVFIAASSVLSGRMRVLSRRRAASERLRLAESLHARGHSFAAVLQLALCLAERACVGRSEQDVPSWQVLRRLKQMVSSRFAS